MKSVSQTTKRAVLYARVSTDEQAERGYSLPEQIRDLTRHASSKGWDVIGEPIVDDGYTGCSMNRPGLNRIKEMATSGEIDVILVRKWDRLFRKSSYQDIFILEMQTHNVDVVSLDGQDHSTPEGKLFNRIQADFAEYFRDQIIANMRQGKQGRARSGKIVPGRSAPLGFEYDPEIGNYRIVPEKMAIVRRIFEEVGLKGNSMRSVKLAFEAEGIRPPGYERALRSGEEPPKYWAITTIRRIIQNDVYVGVQWFNRKRVEKNPDASNGKLYNLTPNPEGEWIAVEVPDAGIPREWIEAAREAISKNVRPSNAGRRPWMLKGIVHCECGTRMTSFTINPKGRPIRFYYVCARHRRDGPGACPHFKYHPATELEHRVERVILDLIRKPEIMLERVQKEIEAREAEVEDAASQIAAWESVLEKIARKRASYQDQAAEGLMTLEELRPKLEELEREAARAEKELERLREPEKALSGLAEVPVTVEQYIAELPEIVSSDPERKTSHLGEIYRQLNLDVLAKKDGSLVITGAFGERDLDPNDPGPFIGIRATRELDAEAYTWTDVPAPDDPFWDTWKEGDPVIRVCKIWRTSPSTPCPSPS